MLLPHYGRIMSIFKWYCADGGGDVFCLSWNAFSQFCHDIDIMGALQIKDIDTLFIATNVASMRARQVATIAAHNDRAAMRFEFLEALVRLAKARYVKRKGSVTHADAVRMFLDEYLLPNAKWDNGHKFRHDELWTQTVDMVYKAYEADLIRTYDAYSGRYKLPGDKPWMSYEEFVELISAAGLYTGGDNFNKSTVKQTFLFSMQLVMQELVTTKHHQMERVEFYEAVSRGPCTCCAAGIEASPASLPCIHNHRLHELQSCLIKTHPCRCTRSFPLCSSPCLRLSSKMAQRQLHHHQGPPRALHRAAPRGLPPAVRRKQGHVNHQPLVVVAVVAAVVVSPLLVLQATAAPAVAAHHPVHRPRRHQGGRRRGQQTDTIEHQNET